MAFSASNLSAEPRSFSLGPLKAQLMTFSAASGDTSGTVTADRLSKIEFILVNGVVQSAAATFSANVATLTFIDPAATVVGQILCLGR
jgi:hypothetical protein